MADWYHENTLRMWPLQDQPITFAWALTGGGNGGAAWPLSTIVDFGAVLGPGVVMQPTGQMWLDNVVRSGTTFTFTIRSTFEGITSAQLVFVRDLSDPIGTTQFATADSAVGGSLPGSGGIPLWTGWLVTGPMTDLAAILTGDGGMDHYETLAAFEPSCIRTLFGNGVSSVSVANQTRTMATTPGLPAPPPNYSYVMQAQNLSGPVTIVPGYNTSLRMDDFESSLTISASVGAGAGQPCGEVPVVSGEAAPTGSPFLSGGPSCGMLIKTINGLTGLRLTISGGTGITVAPNPGDVYGIIVSGAMNDMSSCPGQS